MSILAGKFEGSKVPAFLTVQAMVRYFVLYLLSFNFHVHFPSHLPLFLLFVF